MNPGDPLGTPAASPRHMRGNNRAAVLRLLQQHDSLSRADLARKSGLSEATVSRIIAELRKLALVSEDGEENSTGGRPGTRLQLEPSRLALGVEMGKQDIRLAISTMRGHILHSENTRTPASPAAALRLIAERFTALQTRYGRGCLEGIGVAAHGIVNSLTGVIELDPSWVRISAKDKLEALLKVPVFVENNVRIGALAEYHHGGAAPHRDRCLLFVKVDEGVGIGVVLDGKVHHGTRMAAGEFGQMVIRDDGGPERLDRKGCLEQLASNAALCSAYSELQGGRKAHEGSQTARVRKICHLAAGGDPLAVQAVRRVGRYLGIGISNLVWGLDADSVIIDSDFGEAWPLVASVIREQFPERQEIETFRRLRLRPSALRGNASILGAAMLPFTSWFARGEAPRLSPS